MVTIRRFKAPRHLLKKLICITGLIIIFLGLYYYFKSLPSPNQKIEPNIIDSPLATNQEAKLIIEKLSINVPILFNVSGANESIYLKAIERGVAHFAGTVKPGEQGNSVIFGHSSYYKNKPGDFKEVFKQLDQLSIGDKILVTQGNDDITFLVTETKIVQPDDLTVLESGAESNLTLITCWPPGSTSKRMIVRAKRGS